MHIYLLAVITKDRLVIYLEGYELSVSTYTYWPEVSFLEPPAGAQNPGEQACRMGNALGRTP